MESVGIVDALPIRESRAIMARLASFDWDSSIGLSVVVVCGEMSFRARQVSRGNVEGHLTVGLSPAGSWDEAIALLGRMQASSQPITVNRAPPVRE